MLIKFSLCVIYRDLSNNILERLPPELFLSTRNLTELYVWRFHYTTRKSSFQILAECKLEREQKNRRSSWWWGYRPATPSFVNIFCSRLAIHAYKINNYMGLKISLSHKELTYSITVRVRNDTLIVGSPLLEKSDIINLLLQLVNLAFVNFNIQ